MGITNHADIESNERTVREGFWDKVKQFAGKVPFIPDAVAIYYCATDTRTPLHARAIAFSALAYFIIPIDAVPDMIPVAGFADDAGAIAAAMLALAPYITDEHRKKAAEWLGSTT